MASLRPLLVLCFVTLAPVAVADEGLAPRFFRGLNLNGPAVTIDGQRWQGKDAADYETKDQAFENHDVVLVPKTDSDRARMIRSSRWNSSVRIQLRDVPPGEYTAFVYVWEDNNSETISLALQGDEVLKDFRTGNAGEWQRLGPFVVKVGSDRAIVLTSRGGAANISGIEVWQGRGAVPSPGDAVPAAMPTVAASDAAHFRSKIGPLLVQHCSECHNASDSKGGLDLSHPRTAFAGGESGAAIVPRKPDDSLIWQYVESDEMPLKRPALNQSEKDLLHAWIKQGAPWPDEPLELFALSTERRAGYDWWSWQPLQRSQLPAVKNESWCRNEIDRYILAGLEQEELLPAAEADRRTLLRRVTFDLIGLPPTPAEMADFLADKDPLAYEKVVDRLLASPHYGERWARYWLDVIRFGESQGYERNRIRENAWRFRDWVIAAFNRNLPYDEFVRQQIAGDILYPDDLSATLATGYHVCGTWDQVGHMEGSAEMRKAARQDEIEDLVGTLGQTFLGLTINCARCHDHKFDPISQREYFQFAAALSGIFQQQRERSDIKTSPGANHVAAQGFQGTAHVPVLRQPDRTFILARGDYRHPREPVDAAGLKGLQLAGLPSDFKLSPQAPEGQRRRKLAEWLTDERNPLVARVFVNRVWYYHLGKGLVETPSDFGFQGALPTHPQLLDHLADRFIASGWDVKSLHRHIVTSATYRQSSVGSELVAARDADNRWYWKAQRRRLEGEAFRDAVLAVSGALVPQLGGPSFRDVKVALNNNHEFTDPTDEFSPETCRRSIYRLWARSGNHPLLESLDCPDPTVAAPRRAETITPLQALSLMNNGFMEACAQRFADRVRSQAGDNHELQIAAAYQLAVARVPQPRELAISRQFVASHGLEQFCLTLLNTNEFLYID